MSLEDLVKSEAQVLEQIRGIIAGHVEYRGKSKEVNLTVSGVKLPVRKQILVYLLALLGRSYLPGEAMPTEATPSQIAEALGAPGGTVRPNLSELAKKRLVRGENGRYTVNVTDLARIELEVKEEPEQPTQPRRRRRKPRGKPSESIEPATKKQREKKKPTIAHLLNMLIDEGFFDTRKTLADTVAELECRGHIHKQTSMSGPLQQAVQSSILRRDKAEGEGKGPWVYYRPRAKGT